MSRWPLIEETSNIINRRMRAEPWARGKGVPDERYMRIKAKALQAVMPYVQEKAA